MRIDGCSDPINREAYGPVRQVFRFYLYPYSANSTLLYKYYYFAHYFVKRIYQYVSRYW